MTDTLTSAWNVTGFLRVLFETATGACWWDTPEVRPATDSGAEVEHSGPGRTHPGGLAPYLQGRKVYAF